MAGTREAVEVAPGFLRIAVADVNCYLISTADGLTLVDAGLPRSWRPLTRALSSLGARASDIDTVLLTHGHFDHVGMARTLHAGGTTVLVHPEDRHLARHPYSYRPASPRVPYLLGHPRGIPVIARMAVAGALTVRGVDAQPAIASGRPVDAPGTPIALGTPGHTAGHTAYLFPESGVLLTGDALVTLDPYTGERGPQIVARAATADVDQALGALSVIAETGARLLLPGHGDPYRGEAQTAVAAARSRGPH